VLDLTRVIAGPVCTRVLSAFGADVLRIDPPGFDEVPALLPDTTAGKRCAALDLATDAGRRAVVALLEDADVVVHGLRPGAMEALGLGVDELAAINPGLVTAGLDAYGWQGPWAGRRGFDSLVQMSTGIAAAGAAAAGEERPRPLPAQALDHGTGYLLATAVLRALTVRLQTGAPSHVRASLLGTANALLRLPAPAGPVPGPLTIDDAATEPVATAWGPARAARCPVAVDGCPPRWDVPAGPLGRDLAAFR
jgi:crotonobetainyl-CoA:carnitine CoA-transferase CaiB-like acyl-CoA transferase